MRSSPSLSVAVSEIQNQKQKNLRGGTQGPRLVISRGVCLEGSENQKTGIESVRNGATERLL